MFLDLLTTDRAKRGPRGLPPPFPSVTSVPPVDSVPSVPSVYSTRRVPLIVGCSVQTYSNSPFFAAVCFQEAPVAISRESNPPAGDVAV